MIDVLQMIETRWKSTDIMGSRLFDSPAGGQVAMQCLQLGFRPKRAARFGEHDYPFLVLRVKRVQNKPGISTFIVELIAGFYINPDRDGDGDIDGDDDSVTAAEQAMIDIGKNGFDKLASDANYSPYSLEETEWWIGDKKDGLHPSPDYFEMTAELVFSKESIF